MAKEQIRAFYVVSTHWDREWYESFQQFRFHLVSLLDEVLDVMQADERFACFQTDGQSILLEDYLEIRPERERLVREFARAGRLRIGPWYTMPDENIVAPESLVRNLEEGMRVARGLGHVSRAGFVCDIFGHVSQLPQIFRGFGIETAYLFRGVNEDTHGGFFRWRAADGSEVVAVQMGPKEGYCDFAVQVRGAAEADRPFVLDDAVQRLAKYVDVQRVRTGGDAILLFDGCDHLPIEPQTVALLDGLRRVRPDVEVRHCGLDEHAEALVAARDLITHAVQGELRDPGRLLDDGTWLIPGVLSSRIGLKQDNRAREAELCLWAEPFSHLAGVLCGLEYPHGFIRRAWRYVLENHAHDSICGCSPDQVHKDMAFRFDQARMISGKVIDHALDKVARAVELPDLTGEEFAIVVFNSTQREIDEPVDLAIRFDAKTVSRYAEFFKYESKVGFRLYDADGAEIPYDYVAHQPSVRGFHRPHRKVPQSQEWTIVQVTARLHVPAFGYTTLTCKPQAGPTRHPAQPCVHVGGNVLENEHLRVEVGAGGSLTLTDKRSRQVYDRLLVFEERADIGDGWFHGVAVNEAVYTSTACAADVALVAAGVGKATLRITTRMHVPARFDFGTVMRRSEESAPLVIASEVTLRAGADHVEVRTTIDNQVLDHRVRVLFDSGAQADTYLADSAFDVVERPVALPADNHTYRELAVETAPQASWTAVFDQRRGLAVVAPDLPESAVCDVPRRTLALTLLRGFRRTVFHNDDEIGGQSLGPHEFRYVLAPLQGPPEPARLAHIAQRIIGGVRGVQMPAGGLAEAGQRTLSRTYSQLSLEPGQAVVTALRRHPESGHLEVRLFNPTDAPLREVLTLAYAVQSAALTDLAGERGAAVDVHNGRSVAVALESKQIVTLAVDLGG